MCVIAHASPLQIYLRNPEARAPLSLIAALLLDKFVNRDNVFD
jgi:hypothetical protein